MKLLNQYTSREVPGFVNVLRTATNTATVSLWSKDSTALFTPTTRKGDSCFQSSQRGTPVQRDTGSTTNPWIP
ncbi:MAG: hypothetical protein M9920_12445 [Verrucomicrobiae bacterium]|nr:hypothetical protein [Verrucomicrobiae bacterium]